jgi:hypothetical protein
MQFPLRVRTAGLLTFVVLLESIQLLLVTKWLTDKLPLKNALMGEVLPEWLHLIRPEREMLLFHVFIASAVILQVVLFGLLHRKLEDESLIKNLNVFAVVESVLVFLLLCTMFKMIVYDYQPQLAHRAFIVLMGLALLNKLFWGFIRSTITLVWQVITDDRNSLALRRICDISFGLLVIAVIYIPNNEALVARMFIGEQFHHNDSFVFGPAWAYLSGCKLDMDVISQYGLGMPVIIGLLAKYFGGFSYQNVVHVMIGMCIVYYLCCYIFLRLWLKSPVLSLAAILFAIKTQMFHTGVFPIVFTYGSATVIRYFFDVFFLYAIWMHIRQARGIWLGMAGAICGIALFHITAEGIYLTATFYFYLMISFLGRIWDKDIFPAKLKFFSAVGYAAFALATALGLLFCTEGQYIFTAEFWHNTGEFIEYFLSGFGLTPIYESLKNRFYLASLMGFVIPVVYVFTLLVTGGLIYFRKIQRQNLLVVILCVYGLGLYHYYIARSAVTSYYAVSIPYVFILAFWVKEGLAYVSKQKAQQIALWILAVSIFSLATTHDFIAYPNIFNFSRNPMVDPLVVQRLPNSRMSYFNHLFIQYPDAYKFPLNSLGEKDEDIRVHTDFSSDDELVAYFHREFDFTEDTKLITDLTPEGSKVPILSSFEVKMLIQSNRKPFFYYYPMVISRPLRMRMFVVNSVYTTDQLKKTIDQFENAKPEYVFMEKIFLNNYVPQAYFHDSPGFMPVLDYVQKNYLPAAYGKYLVAMKRRADLPAKNN